MLLKQPHHILSTIILLAVIHFSLWVDEVQIATKKCYIELKYKIGFMTARS